MMYTCLEISVIVSCEGIFHSPLDSRNIPTQKQYTLISRLTGYITQYYITQWL